MTMIKFTAAFALAVSLSASAPAFADNHVSEEQMKQIEEMLASMRCEVTGDIEVEDGEIELDDVICAGGQFDFEMNEDLHITGARPE